MIKSLHLSTRYVKVTIALVALLVGSLIYIVFRSNSLLMFRWFDSFNLSSIVNELRANYSQISLYSWVKYNMPAGLWLFSYMYIIDAIWGKEYIPLKRTFLWTLPVVAILSEFFQLIRILPGTFDILDIISYLLAIIMYLILKRTEI